MRGLSKNLNLWGLTALVSVSFGVGSARAYTPTTAQIVRFQAGQLRSEKPFASKGSVQMGRYRFATRLYWVDPGKYRLTVEKVPGSFTNESSPSDWTLSRDGKNCVLRAGSSSVSCPAASFWADLEFSGQTDVAASGLVRPGFVNRADLTWRESDGRVFADKEASKDVVVDPRVHLNVGSNGATPVAVLELRGDNLSSTTPGEEYPLIQFDQTFLAPLLARSVADGDVVTLQASADLNTSREQPRMSYVLASKVEVTVAKSPLAAFTRGERESSTAAGWSPLPRTSSDVGALRSQLSGDGQQLLRALLLTH